MPHRKFLPLESFGGARNEQDAVDKMNMETYTINM